MSALGGNRTHDTRIRNPVLYPLSYERLPVSIAESKKVPQVVLTYNSTSYFDEAVSVELKQILLKTRYKRKLIRLL